MMAGKKPKLLLVDDNAGNLLALQAVLGDADYDLISAKSGPQALELVKKHDVALILLDIQMPGMDGFETARRLKQLDGCANIPIIFITAIYSQDPYVKKGYEVGAVDYFTKPFDPEILKMKVRVYLSFWQRNYLLQERESRLRESEALLQAGRKLAGILEKLPVGVIIADAEGRICQTNEEVSKIWGSPGLETDAYGEYLGWWDRDGKLIKAKHGALEKAAKDGVSTHNELFKITCFDGTSKAILASASPLRGLDGNIVGAVVVMRDVTEQKRIEEDLLQRIQKLVSLGVEFEQSTRQ
jgi:PAS domain S-box-containing protein